MECGKTIPVVFGEIYEVGGKVYSVNGKTGAVELHAEDVGALASGELPNAIAAALTQAKESGEFDGAKGDKGDKGDTGADGPQGPAGKDGAGMDVTGATVGQIAKISAVDDNGVPTAWLPVDIPSGGGGETWELIKKVEISEEVSTVKINADENGELFELSQVKVYVKAYFADSGSNKGNITIKLNKNAAGSTTTYEWQITTKSGVISSHNTAKYPACFTAHFRPAPYYMNNSKLWACDAWYASQALPYSYSNKGSNDFTVTGAYETLVLDAARCIQIECTTPFIADTKIYIFGVRGKVT